MIGIMGGTFNPIHYGHLLMCEFIREEFKLDKILFIPAQAPPHKEITAIANAQHRLEMVRLAISNNPNFEVSDIEMKRAGASYTVETLMALKAQYGQETNLKLLIGADSLVQIKSWKNYKKIFELADIIIAKRPDTKDLVLNQAMSSLMAEGYQQLFLSKAIAYDYSSTEIRERVRRHLSIRYWVPEQVDAYIKNYELYRE